MYKIAFYIKAIYRSFPLELIKEHKEYSEFKERAKTIKQNIIIHGKTSTSILYCIGKKAD